MARKTDQPTQFRDPQRDETALTRRGFLRAGAGFGALAMAGYSFNGMAHGGDTVQLPVPHNGTRRLLAYPQKRPLLVLTSRPVQLETPFAIFNEGAFTPNDAFFVRWHLADVPTTIDPAAFKINVRGRVKQSLVLSLNDLKTGYEPVEIAAVCQCSGNSRGLFKPAVPGGQWANGAMGNALWTGVRLRDVLKKAGLEADAIQVRFNGMDGPVLPGTPDYLKTLDVDVALSDDVIIAYAMNHEALPVLNGFPVRLVVPGWYATYWVKMLNDIEVLNTTDTQFWTNPAYRIPANACACVEPGQKPDKTIPINRMNVRSFITSVGDGAEMKSGATHLVKGIAFDGGIGIQRVLFTTDSGKTWSEASLGKDYGKYSFREWQVPFTPAAGQNYELTALAVNLNGETQQFASRWNPSGYMRNVVEPVRIKGV